MTTGDAAMKLLIKFFPMRKKSKGNFVNADFIRIMEWKPTEPEEYEPIIKREATEEDKKKWPLAWTDYQMRKGL